MRLPKLLRPVCPVRLLGDRRGSTLVEFAFVAPIMMLGIMGFADLAYRGYAQALLEGAVQKASRDSTLEGSASKQAIIDQKVEDTVRRIHKQARFSPTPTRKSYESFSRVKPEKFTDGNDNQKRDPGECFDDINDNRTWDADPGRNGQGGADDVVLYEAKISYPRLFPMKMLGWSKDEVVSAKTLIKNQPFASQRTTRTVNICT